MIGPGSIEPWLRGPLPGIAPLLQPAGHAFVASREDVHHAVNGLPDDLLWRDPGGAATVGYDLLHLSGSTDRLLTYARNDSLTDAQLEALRAEKTTSDPRPGLRTLLTAWDRTVERALAQLRETEEASLLEPRPVGRARLPSTVMGLLFHAAEHAQRHTGQLVATARMLRGAGSREP